MRLGDVVVVLCTAKYSVGNAKLRYVEYLDIEAVVWFCYGESCYGDASWHAAM